MNINESIKNAREEKGISQRELGRRIGKTGQYISYLEGNVNANPGIDLLIQIAEVLEVSINDLIGLKQGDSIQSIYSESKSYDLGYGQPVIANGKISNTYLLRPLFNLYAAVYNHYKFDEKTGVNALDFFYTDQDFAKTLLSGTISLMLGEVINTQSRIRDGVNIPVNDKYKVPLKMNHSGVEEHFVQQYTELGQENKSLEYLKAELLKNLMNLKAQIGNNETDISMDDINDMYFRISAIKTNG